MTRSAFDSSLLGLTASFLRMQSLGLEQLALLREALQSGRMMNLLDRVKALDLEIDQLEVDLEAELLLLIARHQPVAGDLRFVMMLLKSLTDLERAGDYAVHIARDLEVLSAQVAWSHPGDLLPLLSHLTGMLEKLAYAFAERDLPAAQEVQRLDQQVDALYEQFQRSTLTRMLEDSRSLGAGLRATSLARSIERHGDHLVNVAERIETWLANTR
ncbi:phosphate signaling complex protein PhoU [Deinococcus peraridilitoris]|uniref:Phosphate-specific transport system accessory protein PhoU n=1 Tax=Deinococcus peraridilitoris (strain DSM 19664 / LMG 22246 / CIP 109416 / KR-200) TaxID=937777 RepID=K9ZZT6_DEIPD|nr:phosphate signaling complex protein PhoU [Deinococcus peraridilitoris]AFZ66709.1 phosphate transport system regulatory protein PhoU [Deinococcus peraridilitoris DSM 19664]